MTSLVKYDAACRAIADAVDIDEAKTIRDKGEAMRAYARQAKNKHLEIQAAEIRIRAERRIGELMAAQRDAGMLNTGAKGSGSNQHEVRVQNEPAPPTLAEVGIDKKLADRARKYAAIPEEEFDGIVGDWKGRIEQENKRVTVDLLSAGQKAETKKAESKPDPDAKLRREFRQLTAEAQEDDWISLRKDFAESQKRIAKQRSDIADLKAHIKELEGKDDAGRKIGNLQRRVAQTEGRSKEHQTTAARLQRQVNAQKKEIEKLNASLKVHEIEL